MTRRRRTLPAILGVTLVLGLLMILGSVSEGQAQRSVEVPEARADLEHRQQIAPLVNRPQRHDPILRKRFVDDYRSAGAQKREVFKRYLLTLGADGILDILESANRFCHSEAHDLGKEIFAHLREIGAAVQVCGDRCTSGCLHGILSEAFLATAGPETPMSHLTPADVKPTLKTICEGKAITDAYQPGNCAHGLGHGLMILSGYDLGEALKLCEAFERKPLQHYCASGVFMEYEVTRRDREARSLHYPCDTYTRFPAACYRYKTWYILRKHGEDLSATAAECLRLEAPRRRGCFYGLGNAYRRVLSHQPNRLGAVCSHGDAADQAMCINGAIEALADYHPEAAAAACRTLAGEQAAVCQGATRNKRYGLDKAFHLYYSE